jgi:hypothetical protein
VDGRVGVRRVLRLDAGAVGVGHHHTPALVARVLRVQTGQPVVHGRAVAHDVVGIAACCGLLHGLERAVECRFLRLAAQDVAIFQVDIGDGTRCMCQRGTGGQQQGGQEQPGAHGTPWYGCGAVR